MSKSKNILVLMSGSIAAYKTCFIISRLTQMGHQVKVVTTSKALKFIGKASLEGLSGHDVLSDTFKTGHAMDHIHLVRWADLILLCPATANTINKMAHGIADSIVTNLYLAFDFSKPFLIAPAMNTAMYLHPSTQASLKLLTQLGLILLDTAHGSLACGEVGKGRLHEPEIILNQINEILSNPKKWIPNPKDNQNFQLDNTNKKRFKVLITSGGTQEHIDSMRVLTNKSTGKTGAFLAEILHDVGFEVHYLGAHSGAKPQRPCVNYFFTTFNELNLQLKELLSHHSYSAVIHAAAVSDFHISNISSDSDLKKKKPSENEKLSSTGKVTIELKPNFKILPLIKSYSHEKKKPLVIGFKLTATRSRKQQWEAVKKLFATGSVDYVIHNDHFNINPSQNKHTFTLFSKNLFKSQSQSKPVEISDKESLAKELIALISSVVDRKENGL